MDALAKARDFELAWLRRMATEVVDLEIGTLVLALDARSVRDNNTLILRGEPFPGADAVVQALDQELGGRGFAHRRVHAPAPGLADRLHHGMVAAGYEAADTVVMRWPGGGLPAAAADRQPEATGHGATIVEADADLVETFTRNVVSDRPYASPAVIADFVNLARRQHDLGVRFLVARAGERLAGGVRVFLGDGVAQIEELDVRAAFSRRGLGRALLSQALGVAGPSELVFLTSDPQDWPTQWYARLGFVACGRASSFVRVDPDPEHGP